MLSKEIKVGKKYWKVVVFGIGFKNDSFTAVEKLDNSEWLFVCNRTNENVMGDKEFISNLYETSEEADRRIHQIVFGK